MAFVPSNPFYAEVLFTVGGFDLTPIPPQYLKQFTYERVTDSSQGQANKFTLEVFDSPGLEIEYKISQGLQDCKFQYGYSNGRHSKVYSGQITYYDTDFTSGGVLVTIEGVSTGLTSLGKPKKKSYKDGLISDYVTQIAGEEGWNIGYIEPTSPVSDGEKDNKTYRRNNTDAVTFITNTLVPEAKSASSGESGYLLYFEDLDDGTYVYFCTPNWKNEHSKSTGSAGGGDSLLQYEFDAGYMKDTDVISFNPEYSGLLTAVLGSNDVNSSTVDALKNEMFSVNVNKGTTSTRSTTGSKTMKSSYNTALCNSSASADELMNIAATMWYTQASQSYPATLEVLGNPDIEPQTYCSVLVMLLGGYPHHSSGVYLISSVTDDIIGGSFTSKLALIRNGLNVGTDENGGITVTAAAPPSTASDGSGASYEDNGGATSVGTTGVGNSDIVRIACAEEGYKEGSNNNTKYGSWYGMNHQPWCAMFVSWCANQAGIPTDVVPKYASCSAGKQWFESRGQFHYKGSYTPVQGDIIFFLSAGASHTGIVISSDGSKVYTIEGNTSDQVAKRSYSLNEAKITGYGHPNYGTTGQSAGINISGATDGSDQKTT